MKTPRILLLLLVFIVFMAGCGSASDDAASTTMSGATTTATRDQPSISDGVHFGFVRQVGGDALVFDPAEFLSGEDALTAARDDGAIGPSEDLPNDFYIDNPDEEEIRLGVDPTAQFTLIESNETGELANKVISYEELVELWTRTDDTSTYYGFVAGELPMTLTIADGRVTAGEQQYLP
jgi:hypothetical protein